MKSWTQTLALLVVFAGLVGGITFVSLMVPDSPQAPRTGDNAASESRAVQLTFAKEKVTTESPYELNSTGYYDFWFESPHEGAVEVGVDSQSCKCSKVEVFHLSAEERQKLPRWSPAAGAPKGIDSVLEDKTRWQVLHEHDTVTVPAAAAGAVRVSWEAKKAGPETLTVGLWSQFPDQPLTRGHTMLQVATMFVPALVVYPPSRTVPDLETQGVQSAEFLCCSSTRSRFRLEARAENDDPCFVCALEPLTAAECQRVTESLPEQVRTRVLSGYRLTVRVYETIGKHHLDLGPFERSVFLTGDPGVAAVAELKGTVRGEVKVGAADSRDRINLGRFAVEEGVSKTVALESNRPGLKLEKGGQEPFYLQVELAEVKTETGVGKRWRLTVKVPPDMPSGHLRADSAVIVQTQDQPPRRIRIPVTGTAFEQRGRPGR